MAAQYTLPPWLDKASFEDVLKLLYLKFFGSSSGGGSGGSAGATLTVESSAVTSGGQVGAGARSVSFVTSDNFSGTINGVAFPVSASKSFNAPPGTILPAINYTVSAGTLYIDALR